MNLGHRIHGRRAVAFLACLLLFVACSESEAGSSSSSSGAGGLDELAQRSDLDGLADDLKKDDEEARKNAAQPLIDRMRAVGAAKKVNRARLDGMIRRWENIEAIKPGAARKYLAEQADSTDPSRVLQRECARLYVEFLSRGLTIPEQEYGGIDAAMAAMTPDWQKQFEAQLVGPNGINSPGQREMQRKAMEAIAEGGLENFHENFRKMFEPDEKELEAQREKARKRRERREKKAELRRQKALSELPVAVERLDSKHEMVRLAALSSIEKLGVDAVKAAEKVLELVGSASRGEAGMAAKAFLAIGDPAYEMATRRFSKLTVRARKNLLMAMCFDLRKERKSWRRRGPPDLSSRIALLDAAAQDASETNRVFAMCCRLGCNATNDVAPIIRAFLAAPQGQGEMNMALQTAMEWIGPEHAETAVEPIRAALSAELPFANLAPLQFLWAVAQRRSAP